LEVRGRTRCSLRDAWPASEGDGHGRSPRRARGDPVPPTRCVTGGRKVKGLRWGADRWGPGFIEIKERGRDDRPTRLDV
jgi:hypothetical protein